MTITLNRPDVLNALNRAVHQGVFDALQEARDPSVRAVVITGAGRGFCVGQDLREHVALLEADDPSPLETVTRHYNPLVLALAGMPKPVIAAVNGAASGLGADAALACDFIIASEYASFTWSYINRGIIPDGGGMYFLPRRVGLPKAKELIFTGRKVDVDEALRLGIVDRKTPAATLVADAQAWAAELGKASATALALTKTILNQSFELSAHDVFAQGSQAQGICYTSTEHRESVMAFLAKTSTSPASASISNKE